MIEFSWVHLGFLMLAGFVGSFIDAIVGGGGLITLPAWMATGLPMAYALGSNKMASVVGAITSFTTFMRSGRVDRRMLRYMPLSVIGSVLGAVIASSLPEMLLRYIVIAVLVIVALYTFFKKEWGGADQIASFSTKDLAGILFMILFLGAYDGFFGPGTGTFLIFGFLYFGYNFVTAAGNAKAMNLASNLGGIAAFLFLGKVYFIYAIPMALCEIIGAHLGAKIAISRGVGFIRTLYLIVTVLLIGKQVYEVFLR